MDEEIALHTCWREGWREAGSAVPCICRGSLMSARIKKTGRKGLGERNTLVKLCCLSV